MTVKPPTASEPSAIQLGRDRAAAELKKRGFDQVPQLEGLADRFEQPLFSPA